MLDGSRLLSLCPKCASAAIWMPLSGMAIAAIGPSGSKAVPREWRERLGNPRSETVKHVTRCTVGASRGRVVDQWRGAGDISTPCKRQLQLQTSTRSTTCARNSTRMTFSLFSSAKRNNSDSDFDLESALPHHIHLLKSRSRSTITPTMALLYSPSTSGHWHAAPDDESEHAYETVNDLLGVKVSDRQHQEQQPRPYSSQTVTTVALQGKTYRVPDPSNKQFYRELTFLSDEEMIMKYRLVPYTKGDERKRASKRFSISSRPTHGASLRAM